MTCKSFVRNIPAFLNEELDYDELNEFLEHVYECAECKEELTIEILIREGLSSLEEGNTFDLNSELNRHIHISDQILKRRDSLIWALYAFIGFDIVAFIIMMILLLFS